MSPPADQFKANFDEIVSVGAEISAVGAVPIIDAEGLEGPRRSLIVKQIGHACQNYGCFIVENHGIPTTVLNNFMSSTMDFFKLSEQEKLKFYTPNPGNFDVDTQRRKPLNYYRAYKPGDSMSPMRELAYIPCPVGDNVNHEWPLLHPSFRESVTDYTTHVKRVEFNVGEAICESLGLERDHLKKKLLSSHRQKVAVNFYPARKQEEALCCLRDHTDPTILTVLTEQIAPGLQILHDGEWKNVNLRSDQLIIFIGDLLQAISNYRYRSVSHRVLVNCGKDRSSIVSDCYPLDDAIIEPAKELIDDDHPAIYKRFAFREFRDELEAAADDTRMNAFKISAVA